MFSFIHLAWLTALETILSAVALILCFRLKTSKVASAMATYLSIRLAGHLWLVIVMFGLVKVFGARASYQIYYYSYFSLYLITAVCIYLVLQQTFRHVMAPLPGLSRLGLIMFRWAALISAVISLAASLPSISSAAVQAGVLQVMRCLSVLELCLLSFMALSVHALGLSYRSRAFGITLGFGILASQDFWLSALAFRSQKIASTSNFVNEMVMLSVLGIWITYSALPEPLRKPLTLPATSPLLRWNEIASALGHQSTQVAVNQQAGAFFLTDVEQMVDQVLTRNSLKATGS